MAWFEVAACEVYSTHFYAGEPLPDPDSVDLLIVMGGPMSVGDERTFPWLVDEKNFIYQHIDKGKAVLGICLGAQLIAAALGSPVYSNAEKEIGWFEVQGLPAIKPTDFAFPTVFRAFHWHGDTFDLPPGARRLACSAITRNQAFLLGERVMGVQFHLETTPESVQDMVVQGQDEWIPTAHVQSLSKILSVSPGQYDAMHSLMGGILDFLCSSAGLPDSYPA